MKGLLQSRVFKKNLRKWLLMYIGVMVLLTTVVTYSKYISSFNAEDTARVTKFRVKIDFLGHNCSVTTAKTCNTGNILPYEDQYYTFTIDQSDLEVNTDLLITTRIDNSNFYIKKLEELSGQTVKKTMTGNDQSLSISKDVLASDNSTITYRITVAYKNPTRDEDGDLIYDLNSNETYNIYVGYSATQKR